MKRRLRVGIRWREGSYTAALRVLRRGACGKRTVQAPGLYFAWLADLRNILTTKRLDVIVPIPPTGTASVAELDKQVKPDLKNVSADLTLMRQLGLLEFAEANGHGNARAPVVPYDEIDITINLRTLAQSEAA